MMHLLLFLVIFNYSFGFLDIKNAKKNKNEAKIYDILKRVAPANSKGESTTKEENENKERNMDNINTKDKVKKNLDAISLLQSNEEMKIEINGVNITRTDEVTNKSNTKRNSNTETEILGLDILKALPVTNESNTEPALFTMANTPLVGNKTKDTTEKARALRPSKIITGHPKCASPANSPFQLWCIEAKVNDKENSGTDANVELELSLADGTTCITNSLDSWGNNFEHGATEKFCGKGFFGGKLGECFNKIIACDFNVFIRLVPTLFTSAPKKDLQLDWVKVSNYASDMFHENRRSNTFYNHINNTLKGGNSHCNNKREKRTTFIHYNEQKFFPRSFFG